MSNTSAEMSRFQNAQTRNFSCLSSLACGSFVEAIPDISSFLNYNKNKRCWLPKLSSSLCPRESLTVQFYVTPWATGLSAFNSPLEILYTLSSMN